MNVNPYFRLLLGEPADRVRHLHRSSIIRLNAYAIAMHIPLALWAVTGYVIASRTFSFPPEQAALVSAFCAILVYLIERLVLATPKGLAVTTLRFALGFLIAVLGASTLDLVIFEKEVKQSLQSTAEANLRSERNQAIHAQEALAEKLRAEWTAAREAANCEANGTCGSRIRSTCPIYRQLAAQAETLRKDHLAAATRLESMKVEAHESLEALRTNGVDTGRSGLLARIESLHRYTLENPMARVAWLIFFLLILFLELMVVLVKLAFDETVDDLIERVREDINARKASDYREALASPLLGARRLLEYSDA